MTNWAELNHSSWSYEAKDGKLIPVRTKSKEFLVNGHNGARQNFSNWKKKKIPIINNNTKYNFAEENFNCYKATQAFYLDDLGFVKNNHNSKK